ncbi:MAG: ferredoxin [Gammaproteobacteria bacterium]|jgi:ferredoxin|nr:ferredoxin [Gammaproteobacteria bacterium]
MSSQNAASKPGLRVIANRGACCGYGVCSEICPEVFALDDNGVVIVKTESVPPGLENKAREGAQACPQSALTVEEIP